MKREEDEKLWDLLGHSAEPKVSPFFARNVVRKIREAQEAPEARPWWNLNLRWLVPASGVAVAVIAALLLRVQVPQQQRHADPREDGLGLSEVQDGELMADLEDLVGSDDASLFEDESVLL